MDYLENMIKVIREYNPVSAEIEKLDEEKVDKEIENAINILDADKDEE